MPMLELIIFESQGLTLLTASLVVICYPQMPTLQHNPQSNNIHLPL